MDIFKLVEHKDHKYELENRPPEKPSGIFDRANNYILLFYALACLLMYWSLAGILYTSGFMYLSLILPPIAAFVLPLFIMSRRLGYKFHRQLRIEVPDGNMAIIVILISAGIILPLEIITNLFEQQWSAGSDYTEFLLTIKPKDPFQFIVVASGIVIAAPFGEELLFRGFIQRIFHRHMRAALAMILAGIIFGCCHLELYAIVPISILGILFGYIFYSTGNILYPVIAHAVYNLGSFLQLHFTPEEAIRSGQVSSTSPLLIAISLIVFAVGLYLFHTREEFLEQR
jgi:membrane protease YdiL (CAAX protease family)